MLGIDSRTHFPPAGSHASIRFSLTLSLSAALGFASLAGAQRIQTYRPFGTLREQAGAAAALARRAHERPCCRRSCKSTASTCGSCRCASTTRIRCSRRSCRRRRSPRAGARSTSSSIRARAARAPACDKPFERLAHGRNVAGRRVPGDPVDEAGGGSRGRPGAGASRALGRRAVAGAQDGDREAKSEVDRDRRLTRVRVQRRPVRR